MRVSLNEIQVMCRKAFEGMGFAPGDCEDAAELVSWLHLQGLDGVGALAQALSHLQGEASQPFTLNYEDNTVLVIDAHGQSVLRCAATAVELVLGKALHRGQAMLQIHHCHNRLLLLGYLSKAAERGLHVQARWEDARHRHLADFTAGEPSPALHSEAQPGAVEAFEQGVTVLFTRPGGALPAPAVAAHTANQGFTVDPGTWQRLKQLSEQILVESTEASRRQGAGGGSDAD
jgi:LDH2 family malate/lactate/ureidoglycolate dehydrogenase